MSAPRILIANRGEIAVRVLSSARELGLYTITFSVADDDAHTSYAHETIRLPSASSYTDIDALVSLCQTRHIDFVHPGYGFLSESAEFCAKLAAVGVTFVGPSASILQRTGDKLSARRLAQSCGVPVLPAQTEPIRSFDELAAFAHQVGLPLMIKAVDGGGGRGIRLVREAAALRSSFERAVAESPSRTVFAEKAAVDGFQHVEVQILGDGEGQVRHFWERECSIQRRFQKIVEIAPATFLSGQTFSASRAAGDQLLRARIINAAVRMAKSIKYSSLGTWEFLVSPETSEFYFMEINPRLQVEHTITEAICGGGVDLVRFQLLMALSRRHKTIPPLSFQTLTGQWTPETTLNANNPPPPCCAIQLRVTAEDPRHDFAASIGRIRRVVWPSGNGIRVDTHLRVGTVITSEYDSLLAKIIVTGADWEAAVTKARRALQDTVVEGVTTNLPLLQKIVQVDDFREKRFDTQWLEKNLQQMLENKNQDGPPRHVHAESFKPPTTTTSQMSQQTRTTDQNSTRSVGDGLVRKGDTFDIQFSEEDATSDPVRKFDNLTVSVTSVIRNDFPHALALKLSSVGSDSSKATDGGGDASPANSNPAGKGDYVLRIAKQTETTQQRQKASSKQDGEQQAGGAAGSHEELRCPIAGVLVEVLVEEGEHVSEGDAVVIIRQMKMELEVRAHRSGTVGSLLLQEEGESLAVGTVVCTILPTDFGRGRL